MGLRDWVSRNRSFAKQISRGAQYIPDWYERVTGARPVPDPDEAPMKEKKTLRSEGRRHANRSK